MANNDIMYRSLAQKIDNFLVIDVSSAPIVVAGSITKTVNKQDILDASFLKKLSSRCVFLFFVTINMAFWEIPMAAGVVKQKNLFLVD